jgi:competence protein ComEC
VFCKVTRGRLDPAFPTSSRRASFAASQLELRMFNVGEGECILVVFPNERAWIIDCGSGNSATGDNQRLGAGVGAYLLQRGLKLEALIPSHPHVDHAGGYRWMLEAGPPVAPKVWLFRGNEAWDPSRAWINDLDTATSKLAFFEEVALEDSERVFVIDDDITAHLFAGRGDGAYTSIWLHIRFRQSRLLLTGDVHCPYEKRLLGLFGDYDFGSDLLKVTHHGSSSGTSVDFLQRVRPGLSIASTAIDDGHRLERDTLDRLGGLGQPRRVFETHVDGDIIVLTDGRPYGDGTLFDVSFEEPGRYAADLGASVLPLSTVDQARTTSTNPGCE